jgi:hypothetical protein
MSKRIYVNACAVGALIACLAGTSHAAPVVDPCGLLSNSEVVAALGVAVDPGRLVAENDYMCVWRQSNRPQGVATNVILYVLDAQRFEAARKIKGRPDELRPVQPGLGDGSFFHSALGLPVLTFKKGDHYFQIMARKLPNEQLSDPEAIENAEKEVETNLATAIVKRI